MEPRHRIALLAIALAAVPLLAGCLGTLPDAGAAGGDVAGTSDDADSNANDGWDLPDPITGLEHVLHVEDVQSAAGIYAWGDHVYAAGQSNGFYVVDVTDPANATVVSQVTEDENDEAFYSRDVDLLHYDNASRTVAVLASGGGAMYFVDVTDPANATFLTTLPMDEPVHNMAVVPGTHLIYNSRSVGMPAVDIVDASDPEAPEVTAEWGDVACHDVTFHMPDDLATCAGVRETQIWDVSDPAAPSVVSRIYNPAIQIHHQAFFANNGTLLVILDEFAGSSGAAYGCFAHEDLGVTAVSDPVGALWFYDVSTPAAPLLQSWIAPDVPLDNEVGQAPCTAHFGTLVGEEADDRDLLIAGWRTAGTYLVDFSDVLQPRFVDSYTGNVETWETRYHRGYAYTGDTARGMDVLGFVGE